MNLKFSKSCKRCIFNIISLKLGVVAHTFKPSSARKTLNNKTKHKAWVWLYARVLALKAPQP